MSALVVYHSLYGNTALIAEAVADGIGIGAVAVPTSLATPDLVATAALLVVGSPVHIATLPGPASMRNARARPGIAPRDDHPLVRDWLATLPHITGRFAAFDTRSSGRLAGSAATVIARRLRRAGGRRVARPEHFLVTYGTDAEGLPTTSLAEGELERARAWGRTVGGAAHIAA